MVFCPVEPSGLTGCSGRLIPPTTNTMVGLRLELPPIYLSAGLQLKEPLCAAFDWSSFKIGCQWIRVALRSTNRQCCLVCVLDVKPPLSLSAANWSLRVNARADVFGNALSKASSGGDVTLTPVNKTRAPMTWI